MFAGKTTELIRRARRQALRPHSVLIIRFQEDDRYSKDDVATHDGYVSDPLWYNLSLIYLQFDVSGSRVR